MLNKIYLVLLSIAVLMMSILTYFSYSWVQSIGNPVEVVKNYELYSGISWTALWISFVALLIFANILLWKNRRAWALWTSLLFFTAFVVIQMFFVDQAFFNFQKENNLTEKTFFLTPVLGVAICVVTAVGIFFDKFLVTRMRDKMLGKEEEISVEPEIEEEG